MSVNRMIASSKTATTKQDLSPWSLMACGALAGMGYNAALYPADVVKSRMQTGLHVVYLIHSRETMAFSRQLPIFTRHLVQSLCFVDLA